MDPTANLAEQRRIVARLIQIQDEQPDPPTDDQYLDEFLQAANRLAELVQALDEWIAAGGFLPRQWDMSYARTAARARALDQEPPQPRQEPRPACGNLLEPARLDIACKLPQDHAGAHQDGQRRWSR